MRIFLKFRYGNFWEKKLITYLLHIDVFQSPFPKDLVVCSASQPTLNVLIIENHVGKNGNK